MRQWQEYINSCPEQHLENGEQSPSDELVADKRMAKQCPYLDKQRPP